MIVLDEQLLGRGLEQEIARWYRGKVEHITTLRPGSVIKDDAIPSLLRGLKRPTFVTINAVDFWRKVAAQRSFCLVCFAVPDSRATTISGSLRALLRLPGFRTKDERMGKVVRVAEREIRFYTCLDSALQRVGSWRL